MNQGAAAYGITLFFASQPALDGSLPFFLLFIAVWLALWTVGAIAVLTHSSALGGRSDFILLSAAGLGIDWRAGPFLLESRR